MKSVKQAIVGIGGVLAAAALFLRPSLSAQAVLQGLDLIAGSILPTLFPFFVLSSLWLSMGCCHAVSRLFSPLMNRLFHLPGASASALLMGMIGGYPAGIQALTAMYTDGVLTKEEAEAAAGFCNLAGPAFLLGIVGTGLFGSVGMGFLLWAIHLTAALLPGILFRPDLPKGAGKSSQLVPLSFLPALTLGIRTAGQVMVQISSFILFFSLITAHLSASLPHTAGTALLLAGLELAAGCRTLGRLGLTQEAVFVFSAGLVGWGGLCVHCQSVSILHDAGLSCRSYWLGKTAHCLISTILACVMAPHLPLQQPCFAAASVPPVEAITLLCCLLGLLHLKTSSGKVTEHRI